MRRELGELGPSDISHPACVPRQIPNLKELAMLFKSVTATALFALGLVLTATTGCSTNFGPQVGVLAFPIPVSPYRQDEMEDRFWSHERYDRVPVLGPIPAGANPIALDEPSDDEVMLALEKARPVEGGIPLLYEVQRNNVRIVKELTDDSLDPPRFYPNIGAAQLHHAHYKCTIYFTEIIRVGWPVPYTTVDEDTIEVVYVDHDHFHIVGNVDGGEGSNY